MLQILIKSILLILISTTSLFAKKSDKINLFDLTSKNAKIDEKDLVKNTPIEVKSKGLWLSDSEKIKLKANASGLSNKKIITKKVYIKNKDSNKPPTETILIGTAPKDSNKSKGKILVEVTPTEKRRIYVNQENYDFSESNTEAQEEFKRPLKIPDSSDTSRGEADWVRSQGRGLKQRSK